PAGLPPLFRCISDGPVLCNIRGRPSMRGCPFARCKCRNCCSILTGRTIYGLSKRCARTPAHTDFLQESSSNRGCPTMSRRTVAHRPQPSRVPLMIIEPDQFLRAFSNEATLMAEDAFALAELRDLGPLLEAAARRRDEAHGDAVS